MYSSSRDGAGSPPTSVRSGAAIAFNRSTRARHSSGSSLNTAMRARTSSLLFVSCVVVAVSVSGHLASVATLCSCKAPGSAAKRLGSQPTSLFEMRSA